MSGKKTGGRVRTDTIKRLRIQLGLTQEQFAAKVGVTYSTVNRWGCKAKPTVTSRLAGD